MPEITVHLETEEGEKLTVWRIEGHEEISRLYQFDVDVALVGEGGMQTDALVGARLDIVFSYEGTHEPVRRIRAMVASVEDMIETEARQAVFRVHLVPPLWRLSLAESSQVYCDISPPDLIRALLNEHQMIENTDYELRLQQQYAKREYQVQYKESDLAYLSRLCEHLGISFFFEEKEEREVIVFVDRTGAFDDHASPESLAYRGRGEHDDVYAFTSRTTVIPNKYVVRDYNYRMPSVDLTADATLSVGDDAEVVEYGVHHKTPEEGKYLAKVRAEERLCQRKVYEGKSNLGIAPGKFFKLEGHPRGEVTFLCFAVEHEGQFAIAMHGGDGKNEYRNTFRAVGKESPFRPARITPKPRVPGVITGIIDAESTSDYAQIDSQGRYRVKFIFDWSDNAAGKGSHPVRMAQPHAGAGYGMHFPLRPGVEVVLTCVEGDPERPIICGTVPNPLTQSPVQSGNNTRNVIRTGGGNEINIDDSDTKRIKMTTPHMKTTFQLGAPNEPESGAVLNTQGAWTQFSGAGIGSMTSVKTEFALLSKMTSAGNVTSIAEKPGAGELALLALEMINTLTELASQGLELYESKKEADLSEKKRQAIAAANKSDEAKNKLAELSEEQDDKSKALESAKPANLTTAQKAQYDTVKADYEDYNTKCKNLEAVSTTQNAYVASDRDAMYALERDNDTSTTVKGDENAVKSQYEALVAAGNTDWKKLDHAVYQAALYVIRDRAPIDAARADMEAAAKKLSDDSQAASDGAPGDDNEAYRKALEGMKDNADEYPDASKELEDDENESSTAKNEALQDEYDENYSETGSNVKKAVADLKVISTAESGVSLLASVIIAALNYFKFSDELMEQNKAWKEFGSQLAKAKPKHADGAKMAYTMVSPLAPCLNLVSADHSTVITGEFKTFVHAPIIGIHAHELEADVVAKVKKDPIIAAELLKSTTLEATAKVLETGAQGPADAWDKAVEAYTKAVEELGKAKATEKPAKLVAVIAARKAARAAKKAYQTADKAAAKATTAASAGVLSIGADKLLVLSSVENAELVAKDDLFLTAEKIEAATSKNFMVEADDTIHLEAKKAIHLHTDDKASLGGKSATLQADDGHAVTVDTSGLTIATAAMKPITLDAGLTGKIELKAGNFAITIDSSGIKLASASGATSILVGPVKIDAKASNSTVSINPVNVQLATSANKLVIPMAGPAQLNAMNVALG